MMMMMNKNCLEHLPQDFSFRIFMVSSEVNSV